MSTSTNDAKLQAAENDLSKISGGMARSALHCSHRYHSDGCHARILHLWIQRD
jgi:hypothetical protein